MNQVGVDVKVNSRQVQTATAQVKALGGMLNDTFSKKYAVEIAELKGLGSGGPITAGGKAQFDTGTIDRVVRGAGVYRREMESIKRTVSETTKDYDKLIKLSNDFKGDRHGPTVPPLSDAEWAKSHRKTDKEVASFWASVNDGPTKRKTAAEQYEAIHGARGRTVTSRDDDGMSGAGPGGRNSSQWMKRTLGFVMAAAGVGTVAGFIGSARGAYRSAIGEEGQLYGRGIRGSRGRAGIAAGIGLDPTSWYGLEDSLSRYTGLNEHTGLARSSMLSATFAKANGLDVSDVAGFRAGIYNTTGNAGTLPDSLLTSIGRGLDKSRMFELMQRVSQNTHITAAAMHGAPVSSGQTAAAAALANEAMRTGGSVGTYAKSQDFAGLMQNGMQGAGSTPGDIMLFKAMGGFSGKMDFGKVHSMNLMKQGGFMNRPDLLQKILKQAPGGDMANRAGWLESMFKGWGIDGAGSELLFKMNDSGFLSRFSERKGGLLKNIEGAAKGGDTEAARWLKEIQANPALGRQAIEAQKDVVKIEAGEKLSALFAPIENSAVKFAGALADGKWQDAFRNLDGSGKLFLTAAGLMAAGGAMSFLGGASGLLGKAGGGALLGSLMGPLGLATLGGAGAYMTFKDGGNFQPADRMRAITGKGLSDKFSSQWVPYKDEFDRAAKAYGISPELLYGMGRTESGFRTNAISKKGAIGVMQVMPSNAKGVDLTIPGDNIRRGAQYMASLLKMYDGDTDKALAAYNFGPGNVGKYGMGKLPKETQKYIRDVKTAQQGYFESSQPGGAGGDAMQTLVQIMQIIADNTGITARKGQPQATALAVR
ncbi:MAG: lytic transglycosylase domain-containing protein [Desulfuromonadales bacterium]|nr:lytic transglycosylase domain-containing protein [Desulfuromonadales bacterium]